MKGKIKIRAFRRDLEPKGITILKEVSKYGADRAKKAVPKKFKIWNKYSLRISSSV